MSIVINAQQIAIAGGGSVMDWANLKKYQKSNEELIKTIDPNRVVFIGNSITEEWGRFDRDFFLNNAFC